MSMSEPNWLVWAREMQAIAQTGLAFTRDPYDRERYEALQALSARVLEAHADIPAERIRGLFAGERGYATPKIEVRGAVFDADDRILMVRETLDGGRWTLPGGWADVNLTPAENVAKEVREESGYVVEVRKLAALWDRTRQRHPPSMFSCAKAFFLCDPVGGAPATSLETSEIGWFREPDVPAELSADRVLPHQVGRMFAHRRNPTLPTDFE